LADPPGQQLEIATDHGQQIVEVVGDAAGQLADRLHLLRLAEMLLGGGELRLGAPARGDVAPLGQQGYDLPRLVADRLEREIDDALRLAGPRDLRLEAYEMAGGGPADRSAQAALRLGIGRAPRRLPELAAGDVALGRGEEIERGAVDLEHGAVRRQQSDH